MKITSNHSPSTRSRSRRRTSLAIALCAAVGSSSLVIADVRVNPFAANKPQISANQRQVAANKPQAPRVPSYAQKRRPQRLPAVTSKPATTPTAAPTSEPAPAGAPSKLPPIPVEPTAPAQPEAVAKTVTATGSTASQPTADRTLAGPKSEAASPEKREPTVAAKPVRTRFEPVALSKTPSRIGSKNVQQLVSGSAGENKARAERCAALRSAAVLQFQSARERTTAVPNAYELRPLPTRPSSRPDADKMVGSTEKSKAIEPKVVEEASDEEKLAQRASEKISPVPTDAEVAKPEPEKVSASVAASPAEPKEPAASEEKHEFQVVKIRSAQNAILDVPVLLPAEAKPTPPPPTLSSKAAAPAPATSWLPSSSASAELKAARRLLQRATDEYRVGAWASAEATAWDSLRKSAEAIDLQARSSGLVHPSGKTAVRLLADARTTMLQARDFGKTYGPLSGEGVMRIARSHQSEVLEDADGEISAAEAIDRYLNHARVGLSSLAAARVEAAQAMDLLAAIALGRNNPRFLPSETALCLRRAALQGQPGNGSLALRLGMHLADIGLNQEARWALQHSLSIDPSRQAAKALIVVLQRTGEDNHAAEIQRQLDGKIAADTSQKPRMPNIVQLTPEQFAAASPPVMQRAPANASQANESADSGNDRIEPTSYQTEVKTDRAAAAEQSKQPGRIKAAAGRLLSPLKKLW